MKNVKKDIKNKSIHLIESSLPGIDSLDCIPEKQKKLRVRPMLFVPIGAAALLIAAILIPSIQKYSSVSTPIDNPVTNPTGKTSTNTNNDRPTNPNDNNTVDPDDDNHTNPDDGNPSNTGVNPSTHSYEFDLENYSPTFKSFSEVTYYSYLAYKENKQNALSSPLYAPKMLSEDDNEAEVEENREPYTDYYGRFHHPLPLNAIFTFSNFLYFEFETEGNSFLEERIGNGHIYALAVEVQGGFLHEGLIILKHEDKYYSCLTNGGGYDVETGEDLTIYSAHKLIEGFDVIKDIDNKRYITLYHNVYHATTRVIPTNPRAIRFEQDIFPIIEGSTYYDGVTVSCSIGEIREIFGLDPNFSVDELVIREDQLVYNIDEPEDNTFILEEFTEEFTVSNGDIYLGEEKLLSIGNSTEIYVSDINKDSRRDIVFETRESSGYKFIVYDVYRNTYLCEKLQSEFVEGFDYILFMNGDRIGLKIFETGKTDDSYLIDYGRLAYTGNDGVNVLWTNYYQIMSLEIENVYKSDGETPVEQIDGKYYKLDFDTPHYVDIRLTKGITATNDVFPMAENSIVCDYNCTDPTSFVNNITWNFVNYIGNGVYRYELKDSLRGHYDILIKYKGLDRYKTFYMDVGHVVEEPQTNPGKSKK